MNGIAHARRLLAAPAGGCRLPPLLLHASLLLSWIPSPLGGQEAGPEGLIGLPEPSREGTVSVERALAERRSVREYAPGALTLEALSQLLWAAQGVTEPIEEPPPGFPGEWMGGLRTAPSAGALYPLELYAAVGSVEGLDPGLYRYVPGEHGLLPTVDGDLREPLAAAALGQSYVRTAPATLVVAAVVERTEREYGERAERYVQIEVGAASENVYLQAEALGLGTVFVGAFRDEAAREVLGLPEGERVFGMMPVGRPASGGGAGGR